jgi:hypothetical protein
MIFLIQWILPEVARLGVRDITTLGAISYKINCRNQVWGLFRRTSTLTDMMEKFFCDKFQKRFASPWSEPV